MNECSTPLLGGSKPTCQLLHCAHVEVLKRHPSQQEDSIVGLQDLLLKVAVAKTCTPLNTRVLGPAVVQE
jgi:hypothetical protein